MSVVKFVSMLVLLASMSAVSGLFSVPSWTTETMADISVLPPGWESQPFE